MTDQQLKDYLARSTPADTRGQFDDPSENRELWDWGANRPRLTLTADGRMTIADGGAVITLPPTAWLELARRARAQLGV